MEVLTRIELAKYIITAVVVFGAIYITILITGSPALRHILCVIKHRWRVSQVIHYSSVKDGKPFNSTGIVQECIYCGDLRERTFLGKGHFSGKGFTKVVVDPPIVVKPPKPIKKKPTLTIVKKD